MARLGDQELANTELSRAAADDPAYNPVLLPPRTRTDIVHDRPAGGSPDEVAAANPGLANAVPATVGRGPLSEDESEGTGVASAAGVIDSGSSGGSSEAVTGPASVNVVGDRQNAGPDASGVSGGVGEMLDGSGMEVPELAVQEGWTH